MYEIITLIAENENKYITYTRKMRLTKNELIIILKKWDKVHEDIKNARRSEVVLNITVNLITSTDVVSKIVVSDDEWDMIRRTIANEIINLFKDRFKLEKNNKN